MRLTPTLLALLPAAFLGLTTAGCNQTSTSSPTSSSESLAGGFAFALDSATRATAKPYADSLRVELRQGTRLRILAASLDSAVRVSDLESGSWTITVGLYAKDGSLKYAGSDTVLIRSGKVATADVVLRPAKGSVDITIRIDTTGIPDCPPFDTTGPVGYWYLQTVQGKPVVGRSIALILDPDGSLSGTDGCNHIAGGWKSQGSSLSLSYAQTLMACEEGGALSLLPYALAQVRGWKRNAQQLSLLDSAGAVLATYGTRPMEECATPGNTSPVGTWLLQVAGTDTLYANRYELFLDSNGTFSGTDGCNTLSGRWSPEGTLFRVVGSTKMACLLNPLGDLDLWSARSWKLDTAGNDRHLLLLDSLGKTVAVYGTYVLHPTGALVPKPDQVISVDSIDTTAIPNRVPVSLVSSVRTDSGLLLSVMLPHPGVNVRMVQLPAEYDTLQLCTTEGILIDASTTTPGVDTLPTVPRTCTTKIQPRGTTTFALLGQADPAKAYIQVLTPATVLVKGFKPDLCGEFINGYSIRDGYGKLHSVIANCALSYID